MRMVLCLLVAFAVPAAAQREEKRTIRFRAFCFEYASAEREVTVSGDPTLASRVTLGLSRRLGSEQHEIIVAGGRVVLGKLGVNAEEEPVLEPMAVAKLPASGGQFLFLLVPSGEDTGEVYRCMVFADDTKNFPRGAFRLINLSPRKLRFAMGGERVELLPGAVKVLEEISGVRGDGRFPYVAQYEDGESWNRLSTGYWTRHERTRSIQVAFMDPRTRRLRMRGYDDRLPVVLEGG